MNGFVRTIAVVLFSCGVGVAEELRDPVEGADYLAIVPPAFAGALDPLVEHRREEGLRVRVLEPEAIYDAFGDGRASPEAIRRFLRHAHSHWPRPAPRFLLLAADATRNFDHLRENTIPTGLVETYLNGETASDHVYADLSGDEGPELAVGRLPARSVEELAHFVARTIEYETEILPGEWRRRISFITGEGGFGRAADKLLETVFERLISDRIPDLYDVNVTYANPGSAYCCDPGRFGEKTIERLNDGSLFYVYVGHGQWDGFDRLEWKGRNHRILSLDHLDRVEVQEGAPIAVVIACTTGQFDHPSRESIGEGLLRRPRGPVAFLGSSRISHPYPNAILGKELIDVVLSDLDGMPTLGEGVRRVKERLLAPRRSDFLRLFIDGAALAFVREGPTFDRLRAEHLHLYNLLGDPALRVGAPKIPIELSARPRRQRPGGELVVTGRVATIDRGRVVVTLEAARDRILEPLEPVRPDRPGAEARIARNYERANRKEVAREVGDLEEGRFERRLALPEDLPTGTYRIVAYIDGRAAGATRVRVER